MLFIFIMLQIIIVRIIMTMSYYYLESDEVDHELLIQNLMGLDKDLDKRRKLRRILREERGVKKKRYITL